MIETDFSRIPSRDKFFDGDRGWEKKPPVSVRGDGNFFSIGNEDGESFPTRNSLLPSLCGRTTPRGEWISATARERVMMVRNSGIRDGVEHVNIYYVRRDQALTRPHPNLLGVLKLCNLCFLTHFTYPQVVEDS